MLTKLRAKHAETVNGTFGINGHTGEIVDMQELGVWEPYAVKVRRLIAPSPLPTPKQDPRQQETLQARMKPNQDGSWPCGSPPPRRCGRLPPAAQLSAERRAAHAGCQRRTGIEDAVAQVPGA